MFCLLDFFDNAENENKAEQSSKPERQHSWKGDYIKISHGETIKQRPVDRLKIEA